MNDVFSHPWLGGLFQDAKAAAIWSPDRQVAHMLAFEAALTRAFGDVDTLPADVAKDVAETIADFSPNFAALRSGTARDGVVVPALVQQLRSAVGPHAKAVHTGATSQDVIDTALALTLRETNDLLKTGLETTLAALNDLTTTFGANQMKGRTRMQAAIQIDVADRLVTWSAPLQRHIERLEALRPRVEVLQLGGAVGNRAAFADNADAIVENVANRLNLSSTKNAWHSTRDGVAEYANLLALITGSIGKMGQDICLMTQQGIDEIDISDGGGSSAMPHKQNPVLPELLGTLARFNATQVAGMHHAMLHEQERSGAAWSLEWMILPQMAQATARSLSAAAEICSRITRMGS